MGFGRQAFLGFLLGAVAACNSTPDVKPSPLPPGYFENPDAKPPKQIQEREEGKDLDETLAVVEGKPIFRRRLERETGGRPKGMDDERFERQLRQRLKERTREELFVNEAKRATIHVPAQMLDGAVKEQAKRMVADASKTEGRPVTFEELLKDRGITEEEFRENVERQGMYELYMKKILEGIGGTRPMVGMEVSPAEIRRIYRDHPGEFDLKRAVKLAIFQLPLPRYTEGGVPLDEGENKARADARALAAGFRAGEEPEALARTYDLDKEKGEWRALPQMIEEGDESLAAFLGKDATAWLFDPARKSRDAIAQPHPAGPRVFGLLEVQAPRARDWDEVTAAIIATVQRARKLRVEANLLINVLGDRSIVWPAALADEIVDDCRKLLAEMDKDPILAAARFQ